MEYPGSKLKKPIRTTILIIFIALFLILAPALIMYISGYRYDWKKGILKETGAINIDIEPKSASVVINNIPIKSKMPVRLSERLPGKYQLYISSPGYFDWRKEIEVKSKQTVYIKEISLLKNNSPEILIAGDYANIALSSDNNYLSYESIENDKIIIKLFNINKKNEINLIEYDKQKKLKVVWAPNNNYFVISDANPPYNTFLIYNAEIPDKTIDLISLTRYPIDKFQWKESAQPEIYFSTDLRLMSFVPSIEQRYVLSKNEWVDWYMENGQLWTLQLNTSSKKIRLVRDTLGFAEIFADEAIFQPNEQDIKIAGTANNYVLLKINNLPEMILISANKKFNIAGEKYFLSPYNNWLLIWTPWEIWTFSKNDTEPNLLTRSGEGLRQLATLDKFNTLALIWENKATALFPYYLVSHDLIESRITSISVNTKKQSLFFTAEINGVNGIWQLNY